MQYTVYPKFDSSLSNLYIGPIFNNKTNVQVKPTSATVTVSKQGVTYVNAGVVTIDQNGFMEYVFSVPETALLSTAIPAFDYRVQISATDGIDDYEKVFYFDVILYNLTSDLTDWDLTSALPILSEHRDVMGKVRAKIGSTDTTIISDNLEYPADQLIGSDVKCLTGANNGIVRTIVDFDSASNEITLNKAFPYTVQHDNQFELIKSFNYARKHSWKSILIRIARQFGATIKGKLIDPIDLRDVHLFQTLVDICTARSERSGDQFSEWYKNYADKMEAAFQQVYIKIDNEIRLSESSLDLDRTRLLVNFCR